MDDERAMYAEMVVLAASVLVLLFIAFWFLRASVRLVASSVNAVVQVCHAISYVAGVGIKIALAVLLVAIAWVLFVPSDMHEAVVGILHKLVENPWHIKQIATEYAVRRKEVYSGGWFGELKRMVYAP